MAVEPTEGQQRRRQVCQQATSYIREIVKPAMLRVLNDFLDLQHPTGLECGHAWAQMRAYRDQIREHDAAVERENRAGDLEL